MKTLDLLKRFTDKHGVAYASYKLGFRDTGRVKNWLLRKKIPKEFEVSVKELLKS